MFRIPYRPLAGLITLMAVLGAAHYAQTQDAKDPTDTKPAVSDEKPAKPRFVDHGDYVEDTRTRLLWQKDGAASGKLNFYDAATYAKELKLGGLTRWRVPSAKELAGIFPATDKPFTNTKYNKEPCCAGPGEFNSYWTNQVDPRLEDYAYVYQWYDKGGANNCFASKNFVYVRCVHDPVKPVKPLDEAAIKRAKELIAQLGDESFEVRAKATSELKDLGAAVAPFLREALEKATDAEVRARLESLLRQWDDE